MTLVPPGCETGIYYILLAGLAWATDWKILKSFVRKNNGGPPIEVDYIEVYADGIGGWVRVLGIRNFRMALELLSQASIQGHRVIADGRNETMAITLRRMPSTARHHGLPPAGQAPFSSSASNLNYPTSPACAFARNLSSPEVDVRTFSPPFSAGTYIPVPPPVYDIVPNMYNTQQLSRYFPVISRVGFTRVPVVPVTIQPQFNPSYAITQVQNAPPATTPLHQSQNAMQQPTPSQSGSMVKTEARKVIITKLPSTAIESDIHDLLNHMLQTFRFCESYQDPIQSVELPRHSNAKPKGHAFVLLEAHNLARHIVVRLDGYVYRGRSLQVRLAKEGAKPSQREPLIQPQGLQSPGPPQRRPLGISTTDSIDRSGTKPSSSKEGPQRRHSGPSSRRCSRGQSGKAIGKSKEKVVVIPPNRTVSCPTPVVADGSSHYRK